MNQLDRLVSSLLFVSVTACGGVADTGPTGDGDGDAERPGTIGDEDKPRPVSGDGDAHGDGDGDGDGDAIAGVGGSLSHPTVGEAFLIAGRGTEGDWDGYFFTAVSESSSIMPSEFTGSQACVSGTLLAGYEEWAMVGWNIGQKIDPETLAGLTPHAISPGGIGVNVQVLNSGSTGLRVVLWADETGEESWCASVPAAGGVIPWSDFRKECWTTGGEVYDGVTPITVVGVLTYGGSDTLPMSYDYCVLHLGPAF